MSSHLKALAKRTNPETIAVFPLGGAVLLPGAELPLNIFEPRYLNMIDDALKSDRLIGMVQPASDTQAGNDILNGLHMIGGLGRIVQFAESESGRYMVVLKGLKRFRLVAKIETDTPYAQAKINYVGFEDDIEIHDDTPVPAAFQASKGERGALTMAMKSYARTLGVQLDWDALKEIPLERLVDQAAMISPFSPADKQSLLEAQTHADRRRLLIGLMHLHSDTSLYSDVESSDDNGPTLQ